MLPDSVKTLINEEQTRQNGQFIKVELDSYLTKLDANAEIIADFVVGRCRGFVAYYCNDIQTKTAFITLVLVDPQDRGLGLGQALTSFVLSTARHRGFKLCRLEVNKTNNAAYTMYVSQGFYLVEDRGEMLLMELAL